MATTQNTSYFSELERGKDTSKDFIQGSVDSGTLGQEYTKGEWAVDENLTAFDTSPVFTSEKPSTTKTEEKASEADEPTSIKKKLGANQDVIDGLSHVTFVTGCEMSDAIAYIRYWSRSGVTPKTTVTPEQAYTLPSDVSKELGDALGDMYRLPEDFNTSYALPEDYNPLDYYNLAAESNKTTLTVPENTAYQSRPRQPVPTRQPSLPTLDFKAGNVFSANPSGIVQGSTSAAPSDAVWHFLFNPEELQLSSGPEYNKAETWGVSDPANSGQPLSWRNNRNRKLTFNKVLLHGYSFGKRVDSLEKGLQDLFMAREGEGSDGPPVLEFVWGKRVFGPCVIQNIQVREKAWDKGLLVNAEVSFDLEQVPEWTINDGFVDVLRPGRQPLINDPVLPPSTQAADDSSEKEKANDDGGGGGQQPKNQYDPNLCQFASNSASNFYKLASDTDQWLRGLRIDPILPPGERYIDEVIKIKNDFSNIRYQFYKGSSLIGNYVDAKMRTYAPGCSSKGEYNKGSWISEAERVVQDLFDAGKYKSGIGFINGCAKNIEKHIKEWQADPKNLKCQPEREQAAKLAEAAKCQQFQLGRRCDQPGSQTSCPSVNGGKTVFCRRNPSKQGSAFVWSNK